MQTEGHIIMAYCLLYNLIRKFMPMNHVEEDEIIDEDDDDDDDNEVEFITTIATSNQWTIFRNTLAQNMLSSWRTSVRQ